MENKDKLSGVEVVGEIELPQLDVKKYVGKTAPIESANVYEGQYGHYVRVETAIIDTVGEGEAKIEVRARRVFGLQKDKDGRVGWGRDTKLGAFMAAMKCASLPELVGKDVQLQKRRDNDGREFLTFE